MNGSVIGRIRECLHYAPETGLLHWIKPTNRRIRVGAIAGSTSADQYVRIKLDGRNYLAHRLAFVLMNGDWPEDEVDHRNRESSGNQWSNLRPADRSGNNHNRSSPRASRGLPPGIQERPSGRFTARIKSHGISTCLGTFDDPNQASTVYQAAKSVANGPAPSPRKDSLQDG